MNELIDQFNLPSYVKNKSFADASSMIMDKFRERKDPESKRTMTEMLDRLRQAQEFVKEQNKTPEEKQQEQMQMQEQQMQQEPQDVNPQMEGQPQQQIQQPQQQTQFAKGGLMNYISKNKSNGYANGGFIDDKTQSDEQMNQVIGGAQDAVASAFGPIGGAVRGVQKLGGAIGDTIGGDAGALVGGMFNPIEGTMSVLTDKDASTGQKILGAVPGLGGLGSKKLADKRELKQERNQTQLGRNQALNTFAEGGQMTNQYALGDWLKPAGIQPLNTNTNLTGTIDPTPAKGLTFEKRSFGDVAGNVINKVGSGLGTAANKTGKFLNENKGDILRYAPTAINAAQLATLPKAEVENLNRLDNRYKPNYVDEAALQNISRENFNMSNQALAGASGGSTSALRSNILGAGLNRGKALSSAYLKADDINRGQDATAQQFNAGIDRANLQQSNSEKDINARNRAARDNEKSKLLAGIGTNLGEIGKEEKYKDIIGKITGYNQKGELKNKKKPKVKSITPKARGISKPNITRLKHKNALNLKPINRSTAPVKKTKTVSPKKKSNYIPKHVLKNTIPSLNGNPLTQNYFNYGN